MLNTITFKINFTLTKLKKSDSKFRITKIHSDNDKNNDLAFGNNFNIPWIKRFDWFYLHFRSQRNRPYNSEINGYLS